MKNTYTYILSLFCGDRANFQKPFTKGNDGFVYATNSIFAVRVPHELVGGEYAEGTVEIGKVFEPKEGMKTTVIKTVNDMLGIMAQYEIFVSKNRECLECRGSGEGTCFHCGNDAECEECNGTGGEKNVTPAHSIRFA